MSVMHYGTITADHGTITDMTTPDGFDALRGQFSIYTDKNWYGDLLAPNLLPSLFLTKSEHYNPSYSAFKSPLRTLLSADTTQK